ncbi:MAG: CPBP family intramembrane glutamic endopeptidase [Pseudoxanthomonas sp.]
MTPPETKRAAGRTPAASRPLGKALSHFAVDVVLAAVAMLVLSLIVGLGLATFSGLRAGLSGQAADFSRLVNDPGTWGLMLIAGLSTGGAALFVYALRGHRAQPIERLQAWSGIRQPATWAWIVFCAAIVFLCSSSVSVIGHWLGTPLDPTNQSLVDGGFRDAPWALALFAVVLAPAYEELLFRRVLFGQLWKAGYPRLGMALTAALFALLHELPSLDGHGTRTLLLWGAYGAMGLIFAWLYRKTGTLWAPITAHALNNGIALLIVAVHGHG